MSAIGNEYGSALFMLADEQNSLKSVAAAIDVCTKIFEDEPEYIAFLETPSIPIMERLSALRDALDGSMPHCVSDFISLLVEKGYMRFFPDCAAEFKREYNARLGISSAEVTSAAELNEVERERLIKKLERETGRRIELKLTVDPSLVGGMIVKIDGRLYDGSIRTRIIEIREEITK